MGARGTHRDPAVCLPEEGCVGVAAGWAGLMRHLLEFCLETPRTPPSVRWLLGGGGTPCWEV